MALKDILEETRNKIASAGLDENAVSKGIAEGLSKTFSQGQEMATDKILSLVNDFNNALPVISKAGYTLEELEVEIGIPPKLIPHFRFDEARVIDTENVLGELEGNTLGYSLMKALMKAGEFQGKLRFEEMKFHHLEIELSLIPVVRLSYKSETPGE